MAPLPTITCLQSCALSLLRMFVDGRERRIANTLSWVVGPWVTIAPGVAALYYRLSLFTTSSPGLFSSAPPISWDKWVHALVWFSPLAAMGILALVRKNGRPLLSSYSSLVLMWSLST